MTRTACAAAVALGLAGAAALARAAEPPRARLDWRRLPGAEGCPDAGALSEGVRARLGRPGLVVDGAADLVLAGEVAPRSPRGFRAVLTLRRATGEVLGGRELASGDTTCDELGRGLVLVAALMLDYREDEVAPAAPAGPSPRPPPPAPAPSPPPRPAWELRAAVHGGGLVGLLPGLAPGGGLALHGRAGPAPPLLLAVAFWPERSTTREGAGAALAAQTLALGVCPIGAGAPRWSGVACALVEAARLRGRGVGLDAVGVETRIVPAVGLRADVGLRLWRALELRGHAGVGAPLRRDRWSYIDRGMGDAEVTVWRVAALTLCAGVGLGAALP